MTPPRYLHPQYDTPRPVERWLPLVLRLVLYLFLGWFLLQAIDAFGEYHVGKRWPTFLSTFRMFTFLPIHEAGHLFFSPLGHTMMLLGGSLLQILIPVISLALAMHQRSQVAPFALFWVGENMMDVSLYMRDAPVRMLPLLGGDTSGHDWWNLFREWDMVDSAGTWADCLFYGGCAIALLAIVLGGALAVAAYVQGRPSTNAIPARPETERKNIEDLLDASIRKKEQGGHLPE